LEAFVSRRGTSGIMLGKADATPMIAVKHLDRARADSTEKLGLKAREEWVGAEGFKTA
jgi:hypothetical protein